MSDLVTVPSTSLGLSNWPKSVLVGFSINSDGAVLKGPDSRFQRERLGDSPAYPNPGIGRDGAGFEPSDGDGPLPTKRHSSRKPVRERHIPQSVRTCRLLKVNQKMVPHLLIPRRNTCGKTTKTPDRSDEKCRPRGVASSPQRNSMGRRVRWGVSCHADHRPETPTIREFAAFTWGEISIVHTNCDQ